MTNTIMYQVRYRTRKLTKSGRPSKAAACWRLHLRHFNTLEAAEAFAAQYTDPMNWTRVTPVGVDNNLFSDIFYLPAKSKKG